MTLDISASLVANSAQLNAVDIIAAPIVVQITDVVKYKDDKQPYAIHITGGHKPWIACKGMRRLLAGVWGADAGQWIGRWVRLYFEPTATYSDSVQGGVRISGLSHIDKSFTATVPDSVTIDGKKKKTAVYRVEKLTPPAAHQQDDPLRTLIGAEIKSGKWTQDQVATLLRGGKVADIPADKRDEIADALKRGPGDPDVAALLAEIVASRVGGQS